MLTRQTRAGQTITFTYDTLNRLSTKAAPSEPTVTYSYDLAGRLIGASDTSTAMTAVASPSGTLATASMSYDQLNRPVTVTLNYRPDLPIGVLPDVNIQTLTYYDGTGNVVW